MSRSLKVNIVEVLDCPYPQMASFGKNPWIRISINKTAVEDVQNDGVHVFPGSPNSAHCNIKFKFDRTIQVPNAVDTKLSIKVMDQTEVLARTTIKTKPLLRGIRDERTIDLEPRGKLHIILTAIDFGKIDKPTAGPIEVKSMPEHDFLQTFTPLNNQGMTTKKLRDYKDGEIKRELPAIATGTYGIVYKGSVKDHKSQVVAIKDIKVTDPKLFEEWKREVEFMAMHSSPYIVEVFGFAATDTVLTIVMEFADRGMLFDLLHKPKAGEDLSLVKRIRMARHSALALSFLHSNNVLHRDIKSLNILVTKDWVAKLSDFGAAKLIPKGANTGYKHTQGRGTPLWMAPEVRRGHEYNLSADLFSFGVMLFEILEVALPLWDSQRETIVLPSYTFLSAPLVLPLLHMTPSNRPTMVTVAKQIDFVLGYVLTGKDAHLGSNLVVDLDSLYNIEDDEALKRLKAAMQVLKDSKAPSSSTPKQSGHSAEATKAKKPLPQIPKPKSAESVSNISETPSEQQTVVQRSSSSEHKKQSSEENLQGTVVVHAHPRRVSKPEEPVHKPRRSSHSENPKSRKGSRAEEPNSPPPQEEHKKVNPMLIPNPFTAGPAAVAAPKPSLVRRTSTPSELLISSKSTEDKEKKEDNDDDDSSDSDMASSMKSAPTIQTPKQLSVSENVIPFRRTENAHLPVSRNKEIGRSKTQDESGDLASPRGAPPRPTSQPKARAILLYDFVPENPGELLVKAGDRLDVVQVVDVWVEGITQDGRRGWVPTNYVKYFPAS